MPFLLPPAPAEDFICVQISIPNTQQDIRNFLGVLLDLARWYNYERTGNDLGSQVAATWLECLNNTLIGECMDCDGVLECILTTPDIQNAIALYAQTGGVTTTTPENAANLATQLINNPTGCDNDIIYGMTTQLVGFVDTVNRDLLEQIISYTLAGNVLAYLISAIPVVESLPLDEAFDFGNWLAEVIYAAYNGASTVTLRQEVACDLLCLAQFNDCVLTMEQCRDYFYEKLGITLDLSNPASFLNDLIANNLTGTATFYGMYTMIFQLFVFGESILGTRFQTFVRIIQAMYNDPNPDWSTECDDCGWQYTITWTTDEDGWTYQVLSGNNAALFDSPNGWVYRDIATGSPTPYRRITALKIDISATHIDQIRLHYDLTKGTIEDTGQNGLSIVGKTSDTVDHRHDKTFAGLGNGDNQTEVFNIELDNIIQIRLALSSSYTATAVYSGEPKINGVTIYGTGTNPFV